MNCKVLAYDEFILFLWCFHNYILELALQAVNAIIVQCNKMKQQFCIVRDDLYVYLFFWEDTFDGGLSILHSIILLIYYFR